jgi:DNA topoisomerase VI subunit B
VAKPAARAVKASKKKPAEKPGRKKTRPQLGLFDEPEPKARSASSAATSSRVKTPAPTKVAAEPSVKTPQAASARTAPERRATAESMAQKQREISVSEFFVKNRHLLGFDNPSKALLTTIKEAIDNSLDACEEAGILPELRIEVHDLGLESARKNGELTKGEGRFLVVVEDNGPGILKAQVPKIFGKLLYGSKFHRLKQSRGQQGIGISAAAMYGQLTTGKPIRVTSRVGKRKAAHVFDIQLDTRKNEPLVTHDEALEQWHQEHGTRVELEIVANWQQGQRFVNRYVEHTALANPHSTIHYTRPVSAAQRRDTGASGPGNETVTFPRAVTTLPKEAIEIKPHPHGVELGALMLMAGESKSHDVRGFLQSAFSRVSAQAAGEILARVPWGRKTVRPRAVGGNRVMAEELHRAIADTKLMNPPTNCLSPIGDELMRKGLVSFLNVIESEGESGDENAQLDLDAASMRRSKKAPKPSSGPKHKADPAPQEPSHDGPAEEGVERIKGHNYFIATVTRAPRVYRGNPFQVEVGLAYGGSWPADKTIELFRFANRVPLLFQRGACGITEGIVRTDWRNYQLSQPRSSLPVGPMALLVHIASVWVPFTSESKEAVAHYPEIMKEIQLAAQECGRKLATFIRKRKAADYQAQRRSLFELYIEEVAAAIGKITGLKASPIKKDFLQVARKVTAAEMKEEEKALEQETRQARQKARPRDEDEDEEE